MEVWPVSIEKLNNGEYLFILFDDKSGFKISAELLRVECPSADVQGHTFRFLRPSFRHLLSRPT